MIKVSDIKKNNSLKGAVNKIFLHVRQGKVLNGPDGKVEKGHGLKFYVSDLAIQNYIENLLKLSDGDYYIS
jgi:hypothetical protein